MTFSHFFLLYLSCIFTGEYIIIGDIEILQKILIHGKARYTAKTVSMQRKVFRIKFFVVYKRKK